MWNNNFGAFQPGQSSGYPYGQYGQQFGQQNGQQMPQRNMMPPQVQDNPFNWVLGQGEAEAYPLSPGSTVILWDSKANIIYIKSADQTGMPSMRRLKWEDYNDTVPAPAMDPGEFVTRKEFDELVQQLRGNMEGKNAEQ